MASNARSSGRVADEAWLVVAWLHRHNPEAIDFSLEEIIEAAKRLRINGNVRRGVEQHIAQHCVANMPPNNVMHRMLFEPARGRRRLYRIGDAAHPDRLNGRVTPSRENLPSGYEDMLEWYENWIKEKVSVQAEEEDPLLALRGSGRELWADEHADDYVRRLREGWS